MSEAPKVLAVVPARGGSKGLPGKNLRDLHGHPLLAYSIAAGLQAETVDRVLVSTDDEAIAVTAIRYGAEVPFMRPQSISGDRSTDLDFWLHVLDELDARDGYVPDYVVQLRPTSPVRPVGMVDEGVNRLISEGADSLRAVVRAPHTPYKMWVIDEGASRMRPALPYPEIEEAFNQPRQVLPPVYLHCGSLDVIRATVITDKKMLSGSSIVPYLLDEAHYVDIDTIDDFRLAERVVAFPGIVKAD